jgi:hypothetical protein
MCNEIDTELVARVARAIEEAADNSKGGDAIFEECAKAAIAAMFLNPPTRTEI